MGDEKKLVVYGATWCPDARRSRKFLDDKGIAYQWIDIDADPAAKDYVKKVNNGSVIIPTILFEDGSTLVEPSNEELAQKLGV